MVVMKTIGDKYECTLPWQGTFVRAVKRQVPGVDVHRNPLALEDEQTTLLFDKEHVIRVTNLVQAFFDARGKAREIHYPIPDNDPEIHEEDPPDDAWAEANKRMDGVFEQLRQQRQYEEILEQLKRQQSQSFWDHYSHQPPPQPPPQQPPFDWSRFYNQQPPWSPYGQRPPPPPPPLPFQPPTAPTGGALVQVKKAYPHHAELGILPGAPEVLIRAAFRALAGIHHPDKGGSSEAMQKLNKAYAEVCKYEGVTK